MRQRQAFTLVELMVSMALIVFIMTILTQAFVGGLTTFQVIKANGDMDEKMRGVASLLRQDLVSDHFEDKRRLSDPSFWSGGPPREGFFRIWQGSCPWPAQVYNTQSPPAGWKNPILPIDSYEGSDYGIPSWRTVDHMLHFTVRLRGNDRTKFFGAPIPAPTGPLGASPLLNYPLPDPRFQPNAFSANQGVFHSQLAQVVYFLRPNGKFVNLATLGTTPDYMSASTNTNGPTGLVPLFNLYRRVLVVVPDNTWVNVDAANGRNGVSFVDTSQPPNPTYPQVAGAETAAVSSYAEFSAHPSLLLPGETYHTDLYFDNMGDLANPLYRFGMTHDPTPNFAYPGVPLNAFPMTVSAIVNKQNVTQAQGVYTYPKLGEQNANLAEADLLMTDLISFDVRLATPESISRAQSAVGQLRGVDPFIDLFDSQAYYINWIQNKGSAPQVPGLTDATGAAIPYDPYSKLMNSNNLYFSDQFLSTNTDLFPSHQFGQSPRVFDTWTSAVGQSVTNPQTQAVQQLFDYSVWNTPSGVYQQATARLPLQLRILALQITLRVWDPRTQQARQSSFIQDM